jgi:FkbM family methyltransferase
MNVFIDPLFESRYEAHPLVLVDVGARGGLKKNWAAAASHLRVIGFEPDSREYASLTDPARPVDPSRVFFNVALADRPGTTILHVARDAGLSSVFEPNRPFLDAFPEPERFDVVKTVNVEVDGLDNVLRTKQISDVDFIKVDTQGSELLVLRGAATTLAAPTFGVEVEVEFAPVYKGQPLFADLDPFLRDLGFQLFDLRPVYWKRAVGRLAGGPRGQLAWADALYLKTVAAWQDALAALPPELRVGKLLRSLSVCELYGYRDYALELARSSGDILTLEERDLVERRLRDDEVVHRGAVLWGRRRLADGLRRLWRICTPRDGSWSVSRSEIGNLD